MQSRIFIIFMLFFSVLARAKDVTYVKVVAGNPVMDEVVKNFNVVRAVDGEGFVQMIAVYQQTNQYWRTRLIRTDTSGGVVWSKDYILYEDPAQIDELSSAPFSICSSTSEEGYVIAGIWTLEEVRPMEHGGFQGAFYLEVDATGNVVQLSRHAAYQVDSTDLWCFAPLKIKPAGSSGYAVAGVMSDSLSEVTSGIRLGRMCLLDNNLSETKARTIRSQHASNSNIGTSTGTYYDALNNVEVIEIPGEGFHYIFSGSMTGELLCSSRTPLGAYGNALPFIGRFDDTLGYVWHRLGIDSNFINDNHLSHTSCGGLYYSEANGSLFLTILIVTPDAANQSHANYIELDAATGNYIKGFSLEMSSYSWGGTHLNYFFTQIKERNDTIILAGYTFDDAYTPTGTPTDDELSPVVFVVDHANNSAVKGTIFPVENMNYLTNSHKGYLCYKYQLNGLLEVNNDCLGSIQQVTSIAPVIYAPDHALFNYSKNYFLDALAGPKQINPPAIIYRPTLYSIEDQPCDELNNASIAEYIDLFDYPIEISLSYVQNIILEEQSEVNELNESECN